MPPRGVSAEIEAYLRTQTHKSQMRVIVCGGADAGTSTLVETLLRDTQSLDGRLDTPASNSSNLIAYRCFSTDRRAFVVTDTPGHEQDTRTIVASASTADLAVVLVDAGKGVRTQTRRHIYLVSLLGIRRIVVAINKMDLVDYSRDIFERIARDVRVYAHLLNVSDTVSLPVVAITGEHVTQRSSSMAWYDGPTLLEHLEAAPIGEGASPGNASPPVADQFEATIVWTHEQPMLQGRSYLMQIGTQSVPATVSPIKYKVNVNTLERVAARQLQLDDIGVCGLRLAQPVVFTPYKENRDLGGFTLIDRLTHNIVGAGLLHFALRRSQNVRWQVFDIDKSTRGAQKAQKPCILWFTGLSGAGKSTIANLVEKRLYALGCHTYLLDGDNVRHGLNKDLGFTEADRVENIRRVAEVARLMADAGLIVVVSFISPFRAERRMARGLVGEGEFVEVFVDTPLSLAEARDPKGLYAKARRGELSNFTGIDSPYEVPEHPELRVETASHSPSDATEHIVKYLIDAGVIERKTDVGGRSG